MKIENTGHVTGNEKSENLSNKVLIQNYPNPFTNETIIRINTNLSGHFKIRILDVTGREISVLRDGFLYQGQYEISWNGTTKSGVNVKPGIYFCELTGNINKRVLKMCRIK